MQSIISCSIQNLIKSDKQLHLLVYTDLEWMTKHKVEQSKVNLFFNLFFDNEVSEVHFTNSYFLNDGADVRICFAV